MARRGASCYAPAVLRRLAVLVPIALLAALTGSLALQVRRGPSVAGPRRTAPALTTATAQTAASPPDDGDRAAAPSDELASAPPDDGVRAAANPTAAPLAPAAEPTTQAGEAPSAAQIAAAASLSLDEANRLYDRHDYDEARALALAVLRDQPQSVRMRRIVVSASCIMGDLPTALQHSLALPDKDRADMQRRCARYGVTLED